MKNVLTSIFSRPNAAEVLPLPLLEYQSPTASLIAVPPSQLARNVIPTLLVFVCVMVILSWVVPINEVVEGYGAVATNANVEVINPVETAIVKSISVIAGQRVKKGDILAELDPTFAQSDLGSLQAQFDADQANTERMRAEVSNKPYVPSRHTSYAANSVKEYQQDEAQFQSTIESYDTKIKSLEAALALQQANLAEYQPESVIADQVMAKRAELFKDNVGSQLDLMSAQTQSDELRREVATTKQAVAGAKQDLASMKAERDAYLQSFYAQAAQALGSDAATMDDAASQISKDSLLRKLVTLRADRDGSVLTVADVTPGTVMQSGEQLITIQPDDSKLIAQVDFPAEMSGDLRVGQKVAIKFQSYNYTTYGEAWGTLQTLTEGSFLPGQVQQSYQTGVSGGPQSPTSGQTSLPSTQVVTGLFYQANVTIDKYAMRGVPANFKASPGMAITADCITGERNLLKMIVQRVLPAFQEGTNLP
jgi:HlyD family secretion protein